MPNLDKVFNKFFPQSQTGSKGKFLLKMAWTVEILVAVIGICIAIIVVMQAQGTKNLDDLAGRAVNLSDLTFGGIFFIVAIVELTKIPLATAVYYSVRIYWKIIFLIALLLVNVSTFETIVTGFERINRERTKIIDKKIVKYHSISTQIEQLNENTEVKAFDFDINKLREERAKINSSISEISLDGVKKKQAVLDQGSNQSSIDQLKEEIKSISETIKRLEEANSLLPSQVKKVGILGNNKKEIAAQIQANKETIIRNIAERKAKEIQLKDMNVKQGQSADGQIKLIDTETKSKLKPLEDDLKNITAQINILEERKQGYALDDEAKDRKLRDLKDQKIQLITNEEGTGIDDLAPDSQVYRVATWLKGYFLIDYNDEINKINEQIFKLEKQKVKTITERGWFDKFFSFFNKNSNLDNEAIDKQISNLEAKIIEFEKKAVKAETNISESVYADLPQGAITAAFWLWFGVLSFIISVTGTMLAFASLVLLDPRLHIIRNKRTANWRGLSIRISKFFVLINKYIWGKIKRFRDPNVKIVEKEVIVEKDVEKIVEKNIGEKIVYEKVEVPKEVVRKELVYVPLPTDDEELIKKGPIKATDYDKKK
ncbi:hypothetical protein ACIJYD_03115 [Candidatus Pelagibacter bacterium nBUS_33]|uniref:hypothetical protein n=1 Tax=Candidatus Pelagibacter bacterium nBUS_33 TaxID=3374193 RepID=UPI003EBB8168